ncbi:exosortase H-associated membrane protein [Brevundimonas sp.]|uniref:exosortase H-associated membrane protein n=1 Tax=Brevundimonas sp. TaxID=1871086 RepID=UPI003D151E85
MSVLSRFAARTPEEVARRRFGIWAGLALVILLPLWWMWGADVVAGLLRPLVGLVLRLFGLTGRIDLLEDGGWSIGTHLTQGGEPINYGMSKEALRRLLLGFPLALAFLSAPPRPVRPWRAAAISIPVLCLVFCVCVGLVVWGELAPMLEPDLAGAAMTVTTRPDQPPLPGFVSQIVIVGRAISLSVATLITALILWAALNPAGMKTLVAEIKD